MTSYWAEEPYLIQSQTSGAVHSNDTFQYHSQIFVFLVSCKDYFLSEGLACHAQLSLGSLFSKYQFIIYASIIQYTFLYNTLTS